ncbi:4Fe-4S dicluster domain-containing protein [Desulfitobacterium sp. Sab5]|uniref:NADH-quinone oxidoreductase subunit I n=1 Tax=Desulfitobacterium nosdiversum TaxID=3375356 RepID=UPI003CE93AC9
MLNQCQIVYHPDNCLNKKRPFAQSCKLCIEACPHQAIKDNREINAKRCTECGVCMAVCPSDGLVDRSIDKLLEYIRGSEQITLNCPLANPMGFEISCLGILDRDLWLSLLLQSQDKKVEIYTGECVNCPDKKACGLSVQNFNKVHKSWPGHPPLSVIVAPDNGNNSANDQQIRKTQSPKMSLRNWSREKLEIMLPGITSDESYLIPRSRRFFGETWESKKALVLPLPALNVSDNCSNCGVCAAICPQKSLAKKEDKDILTLIYEPFKCVECQRCVSVCKQKALSFENKRLSYRMFTGKIRIHQGKYRYCSRCGKQLFDNVEPPLCYACATSDSVEGSNFLS